MRLGIVADDFTGACDAAGAFGSAGETMVLLGAAAVADVRAVEVVAVDLDVREHADARLVFDTTEGVARVLAAQDRRVLLKIDSTLRGPIGALVGGALKGSGAGVAIIAPAFPAQGRSVREGRVLMVDGARGPRVADVLSGSEGMIVIGEERSRTPDEMSDVVAGLVARGVRHVIVDTSETETLRALALAWLQQPEWLLVGSAGLAREVAGASAHTPAAAPFSRRPGGLREVLVVAGSPAPATRSQLAALAAAKSRCPENHPAIRVLATDETVVRDSGEASRSLAATVAERARHGPRPDGLVIAGGATARAVCDALGVQRVLIHGELEPGIPCGRLDGGLWHGLPIVTKAGAFGRETAMLDAVRAVRVSCDV